MTKQTAETEKLEKKAEALKEEIRKMKKEREQRKTGMKHKFVCNSYVAVPDEKNALAKKSSQERDSAKDEQIRHLEYRVQYLTEDNDIVRKELVENNHWLDNQ